MHKSSKCDIIKYVTPYYITLFGEMDGVTLSRLDCMTKLLFQDVCVVVNINEQPFKSFSIEWEVRTRLPIGSLPFSNCGGYT